MGEHYVLRPADPSDAPAVMELLGEVIAWLRSQGSDQWSTWQTWGEKTAPAYAAGNVWLVYDGSQLIATITVEDQADVDFWTLQEAQQPALYVSKMAVRRDYAGQGLGELLLAWAGDLAVRKGARFLRLDAWRDNPKLHQYYVDRGWRYIRTERPAHRRSGVLFEIDAEPLPAPLRAQLVEVCR